MKIKYIYIILKSFKCTFIFLTIYITFSVYSKFISSVSEIGSIKYSLIVSILLSLYTISLAKESKKFF